MYDSPKAIHFDVFKDGLKVEALEQNLGLRWKAAHAVQDAGIDNMLFLRSSDHHKIQGILEDLSTESLKVVLSPGTFVIRDSN